MQYNDRMTMFARLGFAARGFVYVLVGWFALDAARHGGRPSDNQGVMGSLIDAPLGKLMLGLCALGFAGYAIWRLAEAVLDPEGHSDTFKGRIKRASYALSGLTYVALTIAAARLVLRQSSTSGSSPGDASAQGWSAWLMAQPGGQFLLILVGVGFIGVGASQAVKAYKADFDNLAGDTPAPQYVRWIGRAGYAARALVFAMIGWFVITAARQQDSDQAGGLGRALRELQSQEDGAIMLAIVAVGLMLFGFFSFVEARFRKIKVRI